MEKDINYKIEFGSLFKQSEKKYFKAIWEWTTKKAEAKGGECSSETYVSLFHQSNEWVRNSSKCN